jgi:hypothetical protein
MENIFFLDRCVISWIKAYLENPKKLDKKKQKKLNIYKK